MSFPNLFRSGKDQILPLRKFYFLGQYFGKIGKLIKWKIMQIFVNEKVREKLKLL